MVDDWVTLCQSLVPKVLRQMDWQLISEDALPAFIELVRLAIVQETVRPTQGASREDTIRRATIYRYGCELYQACGEDGTLRQLRAFEEIGRHAQGVAFHFETNVHVVQACVQQALAITWKKLTQIKDPGCILGWVRSVVYHEIKGYWKKDKGHKEILVNHWGLADTPELDDSALEYFWDKLASGSPPDDEVISRQLRDQLWPEVRRVLADNPRYEAVIVGHFFYDLSTVALAAMLQTTVSNIHVLKFRALARLRTDQELIQRFADALETLPGGEF